MTINWFKYTYVCSICDALIEITNKSNIYMPHVCCGQEANWLSVVNATIQPTQTKEETMETTTDNHFMTREFMETELVQKQARIMQLEEQVQRVTQRDYATAGTLNKIRDDMKTFTLEGLDDESLTEYQAEEIAEICGFELTTEFEVEVTVMYSVTVNARNEEEAQNTIHEIDFDTVQYNSDNISWLSSSIDRVDI